MPLKTIPPRAGKSPNWTIRGTHRGVYVERSAKTADAKQAKALCQKWQDDIDRAALVGIPNEPSITSKKEITFLDAAVSYMAAGYNQRFLEKPVNALGSLPITQINQQIIDQEAIRSYPLASTATRNRQFYTPVSAILRHAGHAIALRRPKGAQGKQRTKWLEPEKAAQFISAAMDCDLEYGTLNLLALYTGMRRSELFSQKIDDVNLSEAFLYTHKTKNDEPRLVHLPPVIVAALANLIATRTSDDGRLFRFRASGAFSRMTKKVRKQLPPEFSDVTLHTLRHTWATWMRRFGKLDTRGLVDTGAWKDIKSAMRYEHVIVSEEAKRADMLPDITRGKSVENGKSAA